MLSQHVDTIWGPITGPTNKLGRTLPSSLFVAREIKKKLQLIFFKHPVQIQNLQKTYV